MYQMNNEFSFTIRVAYFTNVKINNSSLTWRDWGDIKEVTECIWIEEYIYAVLSEYNMQCNICSVSLMFEQSLVAFSKRTESAG